MTHNQHDEKLFGEKQPAAEGGANQSTSGDTWGSEHTRKSTKMAHDKEVEVVVGEKKEDSRQIHQGHESDSTDLAAEETGVPGSEPGPKGHEYNPNGGDDTIPDGGLEAWLVVLGAWCVSFCSYGWINSIGTFQEYYQSGPLSSYTTSQISWIPSLQIFFMSVLGPLIGALYDRHGPRLLLLVGSFMHVFGLMMASLSSQYYQFLLSQGVCSAIGVAVCFICAISATTGWFDKRRGLAFGALSTGSSLGGVIFPIMLSRLIKSVGYGWAMRSSAFMILGLLVVANATLKARVVETRTDDGTVVKTVTNGSVVSGGTKARDRKKMLKPFKEVPFVLLLAGLFLIPYGLYAPINYLPLASIGAGMSKDMAQNIVAIYNGGSLIGRFSSGFISDKLGRYNVFIMSCFIAGILVLAMWIPINASMPNASAVSIAFAAMFGIFSGGYISLMASLVAAISPLDEIGYRNGLTFLLGAVGGLTTNPIAGAILGEAGQPGSGNWVGLKAFAGVFMVAGTTCVVAARVVCAGWGLQTVF